MEEKKEEVTGTLKKDKTLLRDEKKMEKLKQKLHTDDECRCLDVLRIGSACADGLGEGEQGPLCGDEGVERNIWMREHVHVLPRICPAWEPRAEG